MEDMGKFLFLAAGAVSLFTFMSIAHWVNIQAAERQTRERFALLKKIAEQPTDSAKLVLDLLREEDAKARTQTEQKVVTTRRDNLQTGAVLIALGVGVALAFAIASARPRLWALGLIPVLVGAVVVGFAALDRRDAPARSFPSNG